MALLDRFRAQPRQKHTDPAVRLAFVREIPIDERDVLAEIAREDPDARVRRAAVAKLMEPAALAAVAAGDADETVRAEAAGMLRDIALEAFDGPTEADALAAVDAVTDSKTLASVARLSAREAIAVRALARITDVHALGSIARHAGFEPIRQTALDALHDRGEILGVAMNSEHKDTAIAAVERFVEREDLEQIAARAKNKAAAKRARALLREMDERAAAEAAAAAPTPSVDDGEMARQETAKQEEEARRVAQRGEAEARETEVARQRAAVEEARALDERRRREAELHARLRETERRQGRLSELALEAEAAAADQDLASAARRLDVVGREWHHLANGIAVEPEVEARFAAARERVATRTAEAQDRESRARREALGRLQQLLARVEPMAAKADLSLKAGERALRDVRTALSDAPPLPSRRDHDEMVHRLKAAQAALTPKVQELRDVAGWQRWANIGIQEQLCEKMEALGAVANPAEVAARIRDLQQQWRLAADVPRDKGEPLWRRFKAAHDEAWARSEAHFAAEAATRADSLAKKVALCEKAESLAESTKWIQTADEVKRLQAEWKTIGAVTHGQEKALWMRFRAACDRFFTRRQTDLAERKKLWTENLAKKDALCAKVEALADSTDWDATAAEIRRLQAEWKAIGPVKKTRSEAISRRFRTACDTFFTRYARRHDIAREERVAACEAICAELEALSVVSHQSSVASQESSVASQESSVVSQQSPVASQQSPVASQQSPVGEAPPADLVAKVQGLRARWHQEIAARGGDRARAAVLDQRFQSAFSGVLARWPSAFAGTDLDSESNRKRMETLVLRMEEVAKSVRAPAGAAAADATLSPATRLARMLKEALASNTIGGKVDDDSGLRAAVEEVRHAQASWSRIGPVAEDRRRGLVDRFERACRQITERAGRPGGPDGPGRPGGSGGSGRPSR